MNKPIIGQIIRSATSESTLGKRLSDFELRRVLQKYEKTLKLPKNKPVKQFILCPVGRVGAGKTTVIKPLAKKLNLLRISTDEIRLLLLGEGYNLVRTREMALKLMTKYLSRKYSIAVDANCANPKVKKVLNGFSKKFKFQIVWIHINPPEEFIINKLRAYPHGTLYKNSKQALRDYHLSKALHKKLPYRFAYVFDTSREDLKDQITKGYHSIINELRSV